METVDSALARRRGLPVTLTWVGPSPWQMCHVSQGPTALFLRWPIYRLHHYSRTVTLGCVLLAATFWNCSSLSIPHKVHVGKKYICCRGLRVPQSDTFNIRTASPPLSATREKRSCSFAFYNKQRRGKTHRSIKLLFLHGDCKGGDWRHRREMIKVGLSFNAVGLS